MSRAAIYMEFDGRGFVPADAWAQEQLSALKPGTRFNVRVSRITAKGKTEREGLLGLWWAGCELLSQNTEQRGFLTKRAASDSILVALGMIRKRYRIDHTWEPIPISLSEDNMDDEEMLVILELARAYCLDRFGFDPFSQWVNEREASNQGSRK